MLSSPVPTILLASSDSALIASVEPILTASGTPVRIARSGPEMQAECCESSPPALILVDVALPGIAAPDFLRKIRAMAMGHALPLVLLADQGTRTWMKLLEDGSLDDIIPRSPNLPHWRLRLDVVLRTFQKMRQLAWLREAATRNAQMDALTGICNRTTLLSLLFRETDRVQRMKTPLCLLLLDIDDFGRWNERLRQESCDDLLCQVVGRILRILRSYDLLGRTGNDEFLAVFPGCNCAQGMLLAKRLRQEVFSASFQARGELVRLTACFGIAASEGRSPVVVLREAEQALRLARQTGPDSIRVLGHAPQALPGPEAILPHG